MRQSLNLTQTTTNNESYIMPYQNDIQSPDKRTNFSLIGNDTNNITGLYVGGDKGNLTFGNDIYSGLSKEVSLVRLHNEAQKILLK